MCIGIIWITKLETKSFWGNSDPEKQTWYALIHKWILSVKLKYIYISRLQSTTTERLDNKHGPKRNTWIFLGKDIRKDFQGKPEVWGQDGKKRTCGIGMSGLRSGTLMKEMSWLCEIWGWGRNLEPGELPGIHKNDPPAKTLWNDRRGCLNWPITVISLMTILIVAREPLSSNW